MILANLVSVLKVKRVVGDTSVAVMGFSIDSRTVRPGDMFVALNEPKSGLKDRAPFIPAAIAAGASCLLVEQEMSDVSVPQVVVPDTKVASATLAAALYSYPADELDLIGVTGTKGKTSVSYFISQILEHSRVKTGIIGTTGAIIDGEMLEPTNSTPHAINLHRLLRTMADRGAEAVAMEVSSHALKLHRAAGCAFRVGVFTNIGHDHIDFHETMEDYVQSKARFMTKVINGTAVINIDDEWAPLMVASASCEVITYGYSETAVLRASQVRSVGGGTAFRVTGHLGDFDVTTRLVGRFNVYNALAALGAAIAYGIPIEQAVASLAQVGGVPGRVEAVDTGNLGFQVVVDYAHTPESLENVLSTLRGMDPSRLITVFGCGGDRDKTKRPIMGAISGKFSDYTIVTSDNPRTEDSDVILEEIRVGLTDSGVAKERYELEADRRESIFQAIAMAEPGDIVAICGKGHEVGQIVGTIKLPFDDREVAGEALLARAARY